MWGRQQAEFGVESSPFSTTPPVWPGDSPTPPVGRPDRPPIVAPEIPDQPPPRLGFGNTLLVAGLFTLIALYKGLRLLFWWLRATPDPVLAPLHAPPLEPDIGIGPILRRDDAPVLFRMLRQMTRWMAVAPDEVRLSYLPACGVVETPGPEPRRVLIIGLPTLQILSIGEVLSVLGHELAHLRLADARFTRSVFSFEQFLALQAQTLQPPLDPATGQPIRRWFRPGLAINRLTAWLFRRLATPLRHSLEYRADRWSADCFGAEFLATALEKIALVQPIFREVLVRYAVEQSVAGPLPPHALPPHVPPPPTVYERFALVWFRLPVEHYAHLRHRLIYAVVDEPLAPHPPMRRRLNRLEVLAERQHRFRSDRPWQQPRQSPSALELLADPLAMMRLLHNHLDRYYLRGSG